MTARRSRLDDASEVYVQRVVAAFPPLTEERKLRLSRLVTPPSSGHDVRDLHRRGPDDVAA